MRDICRSCRAEYGSEVEKRLGRLCPECHAAAVAAIRERESHSVGGRSSPAEWEDREPKNRLIAPQIADRDLEIRTAYVRDAESLREMALNPDTSPAIASQLLTLSCVAEDGIARCPRCGAIHSLATEHCSLCRDCQTPPAASPGVL